MLLRQSYTAMVAATVLAATATLAMAQSSPPQGTSQPQDKATTATGNEAWSKPDVASEPPAPNGGMSSGAHLGNESPTKPGISGGHQPMSTESKENLDRATSGSR